MSLTPSLSKRQENTAPTHHTDRPHHVTALSTSPTPDAVVLGLRIILNMFQAAGPGFTTQPGHHGGLFHGKSNRNTASTKTREPCMSSLHRWFLSHGPMIIFHSYQPQLSLDFFGPHRHSHIPCPNWRNSDSWRSSACPTFVRLGTWSPRKTVPNGKMNLSCNDTFSRAWWRYSGGTTWRNTCFSAVSKANNTLSEEKKTKKKPNEQERWSVMGKSEKEDGKRVSECVWSGERRRPMMMKRTCKKKDTEWDDMIWDQPDHPHKATRVSNHNRLPYTHSVAITQIEKCPHSNQTAFKAFPCTRLQQTLHVQNIGVPNELVGMNRRWFLMWLLKISPNPPRLPNIDSFSPMARIYQRWSLRNRGEKRETLMWVHANRRAIHTIVLRPERKAAGSYDSRSCALWLRAHKERRLTDWSTLLDLCMSSTAHVLCSLCMVPWHPSVVVDSEYTYDRAVQVPAMLHALVPSGATRVSSWRSHPHAPSLFQLGFCSSRTHPRDRWPDVSEVHVSIATLASDGGYPGGGVNTRPSNVSCLLLHCSCCGATRQHSMCLSRWIGLSYTECSMILSRTMPTCSLSVYEMLIFKISIQSGTELCCLWPKSHLMTSWKDLRIRECEKLKTVLELYDLEIHQKKLGPDYHRLKTMVKRIIEQDIRSKNFGTRNGNYEKNAVVKNQGTKQRVQRILRDCWQWETSGQCVKGDNCSFRHDINKRGKVTPSNPSPNSFMQQNKRKSSRTRSPRKCLDGLAKITSKEFAITHFMKSGTSRMLLLQDQEWWRTFHSPVLFQKLRAELESGCASQIQCESPTLWKPAVSFTTLSIWKKEGRIPLWMNQDW